MKAYIKKSLRVAKDEVEEWLGFFRSYGINMEIEEISVLPVFYPDEEVPEIEEVGFEPVLVGEYKDDAGLWAQNSEISYDDYFRVEEIFITGKYRWKMSELAGVYNEQKIEELSQAMIVAMLEDWTEHMRTDHIVVKWKMER